MINANSVRLFSFKNDLFFLVLFMKFVPLNYFITYRTPSEPRESTRFRIVEHCGAWVCYRSHFKCKSGIMMLSIPNLSLIFSQVLLDKLAVASLSFFLLLFSNLACFCTIDHEKMVAIGEYGEFLNYSNPLKLSKILSFESG